MTSVVVGRMVEIATGVEHATCHFTHAVERTSESLSKDLICVAPISPVFKVCGRDIYDTPKHLTVLEQSQIEGGRFSNGGKRGKLKAGKTGIHTPTIQVCPNCADCASITSCKMTIITLFL